MVDLILVLSAGAFGLIATVYSVVIFFESEESKRREAWLLIGGASLVSVVLSGISAYRASKFQQVMATNQSAMANNISEILQVLRPGPKHYFVGLTEDLKTGKSSSFVKEISDAEYKRRYAMLRILRLDYFLEKGMSSPGLVAGTEWPPIEWINQRLAKLGETWTVLPGKNASDFTFVEPQP